MAHFPLLRLPFLPSKDVFNMMNSGDLINLFSCSKKTRDVIKAANLCYDFLSFQKKNFNVSEIIQLLNIYRLQGNSHKLEYYELTVRLEVADTIQFEVNFNYRKERVQEFSTLFIDVVCIGQKTRFDGTKGSIQIDGIHVPVVMARDNRLYTFWNSEYKGMSIMGDLLRKGFDSQIKIFKLFGNDKSRSSERLRAAVKWMSQQHVHTCHVGNSGVMKPGDYKHLLDNLKPLDRFELDGRQGKLFKHPTNIKTVNFQLSPAKWFKLDNLLNTESAFITLENSKLTNDDMKEYLKQWVDRRFSKLEILKVEMEEIIDLAHILSFLPGYCKSQQLIERKEYTLRQDNYSAILSLSSGAAVHLDIKDCQHLEMRVG